MLKYKLRIKFIRVLIKGVNIDDDLLNCVILNRISVLVVCLSPRRKRLIGKNYFKYVFDVYSSWHFLYLLNYTHHCFSFCPFFFKNFFHHFIDKQSRRKNPKKKGDNLDDLKQELDIDFHKISSEELYQRFQTHPENVSELFINKFNF